MNIRDRIDASPMTSFQWVVIGVCTFLNALDGFDVLAMAFTANRVSAEFGLSGSQLGVLLSTGLFGMAAGSLGLAPFSDIFGRRPMLLFATGLAAVGMFLSSTSGSVTELGLWRLVTGLGVGGILACTNVITSEYANKRWRGMAVSIYTARYGVGATLGGVAAVSLQASYGWRSVFVFGGAVTAAAFVLLLAVVPESVDFLVTKRPARAQQRLAVLACKLRLDQDTVLLPNLPASTGGRAVTGQQLTALFSPANRRVTTLIWVAFFATMFGFYFVNSWTPKLLVTAGMTESQGVVGGLMLTLGGTFGALLFGALTTTWQTRKVLLVFTVLSSITMVLFISAVGILTLAFGMGIVVGMLINGCIAGLYTLAPASYAPQTRGTGVGWAIGIGRFGAILAPLAAGALLDAAWSAGQLYLGVGLMVLVAAVAIGLMRSPKVNDPEVAPETTSAAGALESQGSR
ncbi:MFS transporter [Paeniglutamicibacter gangotriensis]|uniref:Benzoate MFS transporter n=1 Tax=Paeniglutamicibacter gangotriensis Lz1y TaxID=1276920 RepID=M7MZ88_9MICC|nr:MFS transporter [Paeniglutamicibacter gangotriensis]EMR00362.1 benzoate MFS transporter [Paeniglutamicibacter gangotriensis Lz1y]